MTEIKPQFIATDANAPYLAIYGIGDSREAAIADARGQGADGEFSTFPATLRLAELVLADGGAPDTLGDWTTSNAVGLADLVRDEDLED